MSTRKIKDAKDLSTNELIYFKGHAQATYMSDGRTVEEAVNEMSGGSSDGNITAIPYDNSELDSRNIMDAIDSTTGEKIYFTGHASYIRCEGGMLMDYIDDKAAAARIIKWDVEAGTYVPMSDDLLNWVYSNDGILVLNGGVAILVYNEEWTMAYIQSSVIKDNTIFVTKMYSTMFGCDSDLVTIDSYPIGGSGSGGTIDTSNLATKTELAQKQDIISDIDTIRSNAANYKGTVTSIKIDNVSKTPSNGVVDLGYINKKLTTSTSSSMSLSPNVYYRNTSTSLSTLTITLGSVSNSNIINEYFVEFTTRSAGTTVSFPSSVKWIDGVTPTWEAGYTYHVSIINNLGSYQKFK